MSFWSRHEGKHNPRQSNPELVKLRYQVQTPLQKYEITAITITTIKHDPNENLRSTKCRMVVIFEVIKMEGDRRSSKALYYRI
jgi:hypothetical protein